MRTLLLLLGSLSGASGATLFFDNTFNNAEWSGITVLEGSGTATSFTTGFTWRQANLTPTVGTTAMAGEVNTAQTFSPGGAAALNFSFTPHSDSQYPFEEWGFLIRQQGSFYAAPGMLSGPTSISSLITGTPTISWTYTALDFMKVGTAGTGGANPDWSTLGGPIEVGYFLRFTSNVSSGDTLTASLFFDNIGVETVPEPGTMAIVGLGLLGLGAIRRWRQGHPGA